MFLAKPFSTGVYLLETHDIYLVRKCERTWSQTVETRRVIDFGSSKQNIGREGKVQLDEAEG